MTDRMNKLGEDDQRKEGEIPEDTPKPPTKAIAKHEWEQLQTDQGKRTAQKVITSTAILSGAEQDKVGEVH